MRDAIHFRLGDAGRTLRDVGPDDDGAGVSAWSRTAVRHQGRAAPRATAAPAPSVLIDGQGHHRAVNACVLFMPALDGQQLLTVEHLAQPDGALHPVQQAMVEHHGSQCGFCTPGFVMSLYALHTEAKHVLRTEAKHVLRTEAKPDRMEINEALAGNLCRCTGYRPIVDAALQACSDQQACSAKQVGGASGIAGERGYAGHEPSRQALVFTAQPG